MQVPSLNTWPRNSEYIMFVDESGTKNMNKYDHSWPILVLSGVIFKKDNFKPQILEKFLEIKKKYWPPDGLFNYMKNGNTILKKVCFHCYEIESGKGPFNLMSNKVSFKSDLHHALDSSEFTVITCTIDKNKIYQSIKNDIYLMASTFLVERYYYYLNYLNSMGSIFIEKRNKKDDLILYKHLKKIKGQGTIGIFPQCPGGITASEIQKKIMNLSWNSKWQDPNSVFSGLEVADHAAWHIGRFHLSQQGNISLVGNKKSLGSNHNIFYDRLYTYRGNVNGAGLKVFP